MKKQVKAVMVLEVTFEDESGIMSLEEMKNEAKNVLKEMVYHAHANGQMLGDTGLMVDDFNLEINVDPK